MEISENCGGNSGNGDSVSFRTKTRNRNMRKVKCDNCGGDNVETIADSFGICRDCGYKFVLKEDIAERRREEEEKNAVTQPIECEKCGSTDIEVIADSFGVCKHCGTKFVTIICLRYGLDGKEVHTQLEVADMLNISRSYVSRIEKKAVEKLSKELKD